MRKKSKKALSIPKSQSPEEKQYEEVGKKLSLVDKPFVSPKQILKIFERTPKNHIYKRPAKGGGEWDFVTGTYVKKVLNFVFGFDWDFEIVEHGREADQLWVLGRLTVHNSEGRSIKKMQFGRADMKFKKGTNTPVDFGNDLKAAATDALKKCASELGIASDIYGKNEFKEVGLAPTAEPKKAVRVAEEKKAPEHECHACAEPITKQEAEFSKKVFGKPLCRAHQTEAQQNGRGNRN